jgi:hypothetical protein
MPPKQGPPPPPPPTTVGDEDDKCVSSKELRAMMKAMIKIFTKNQQSTHTTLKRVECSIAIVINQVDTMEMGLLLADQAKLAEETGEDSYDDDEEEDEPFNPPHPPP